MFPESKLYKRNIILPCAKPHPRLVYANITGAILGVYYVWGFQQNCRDQKVLAAQ